MSLYTATTDIHHKAQETPFGTKMAEGTLSRQEWANWLHSMLTVHHSLDPLLPNYLRRAPELTLDLIELADVTPVPLQATRAVVSQLFTESALYVGGLSYVMCGANLRGGAVVRKTLEPMGFPCHHLHFERDDAERADRWLKRLRELPQLEDSARVAFNNVVLIMQEIAGQ